MSLERMNHEFESYTNPGHVMIATGDVKLNAKGQASEFETLEANSTDVRRCIY